MPVYSTNSRKIEFSASVGHRIYFLNRQTEEAMISYPCCCEMLTFSRAFCWNVRSLKAGIILAVFLYIWQIHINKNRFWSVGVIVLGSTWVLSKNKKGTFRQKNKKIPVERCFNINMSFYNLTQNTSALLTVHVFFL